MATDNGQTNPTNVVITPVAPTQLGTSTGTAGAPLASGSRVTMPANMGRIPNRPTPITPVGRRR